MIEVFFSKVFGKCFFLASQKGLPLPDMYIFLGLLIILFVFFFFEGIFSKGKPPQGTRAYFFFTTFVAFFTIFSRVGPAECMDNNNNEAPHPQAPAAPPAGPEEDIRGTLLNIVSEPAGPLELPSIIREMRGFFSHYATGGRNPSTRNIQTWLATEFSIDQSQTDERAAIIAAMQEIKEEYPPDSLSPGQAKDHLYNRMNTWLDARGRENLNLRKTSWPPLS